jgi:2-aminoethylphosphonate-pyruvate transaminase
MLRDIGAWDIECIELIAEIRGELLRIAGVSKSSGYEAVLMQGSGTFGVESVIGSTVPRDARLLVAANGAYGERMATVAERLGIETVVLRSGERTPVDVEAIDAALRRDPAIHTVGVVHCETSTGLLNPIEQVGRVARRHGRSYVVDAMSSFGAYPIDPVACGIDFLVSSPNKCIEGVPGFSFTISRHERLQQAQGVARSLSLDLFDQWRGLESHGRSRFTPPTHALLAFAQALRELESHRLGRKPTSRI